MQILLKLVRSCERRYTLEYISDCLWAKFHGRFYIREQICKYTCVQSKFAHVNGILELDNASDKHNLNQWNSCVQMFREQRRSSANFVLSKLRHFTWSSVRKFSISLKHFRVSQKSLGEPNELIKSMKSSFRPFVDLQTLRPNMQFILWLFSYSVFKLYSILGDHFHDKILSFSEYIWSMSHFPKSWNIKIVVSFPNWWLYA